MYNDLIPRMMSIVRSGGDPIAFLTNAAPKNAQAAQALQILRGKSPAELQKIAQNMASERGTTIPDIMKQLGL